MRRHKIKDIVEGITGTLFCLVLFAMFSCTSDRDQYGENLEIIDFGIVQQTRATDSSFENGDKIGIYAVESGQSFQVSGNYADNRQYTYQNGKLQPVTQNDRIYGVKGKSYVYHAYYPYQSGINPSSVIMDATNITTKPRPLWSMQNSGNASSVQFAFTNIFALIEVNINETSDKITSGNILNKYPKVTMNMCSNTLTTVKQNPTSVPLSLYSSSNSNSTFRAFLPSGNVIASGDELFAFKTSSSESKTFYATKDITTVAGEKNLFSLTHLEEYLIKATSTAGGSITNDAAALAVGKKFKDGQQCSIPFVASTGYFFDGIYENDVKQSCTSSPYTFNVTKARTLEVRFKADVITYGDWVVSVSASPTTIAATGGASSITSSAVRDVFTNGTKTGTDTGTPTLSISGSGFTLSGNTLTAISNTGSARTCTITATYGGVSKTCTVTQNAVEITYGNWVVSVNASPTTIVATGGTSSITSSAVRDVFTNGTKAGIDTANPSLSISGTGFSLSGTTLSAVENTGSLRSCIITATHGGVSKTCTVTQNAGVITYEYSFSVSPTFLSFSSKGESKSFTITSTRVKVVNGTNTGISENVGYTSSVSGADAGGFSVSGTSVIASENPTTDFRDATVTLTQTNSGKTVKITLEQERKINIDTEI